MAAVEVAGVVAAANGGACKRGGGGENGWLTLLAAKPAAHAAHFYRHLIACDAENMRYAMLNFRGMLGR